MKKITRTNLFKILDEKDKFNDIKGVKVAYAVNKTLEKIEREKRTMEEIINISSKGFQSYDRDRIVLCIKNSEKDKDGNPVMENNSYKIDSAKKEEFDKEVAILTKKYQKDIDERKKQIEDVNKMLEEEIEFDIHMIDKSDIHEDITVEQMNLLMYFIE